jgi:protein-S-isoprenylcysteine O-methyltransferase Ste14
MIPILFTVALALEIVYLGLFWLTLRRPGFRFWPPPGARSWQFFGAWFVAGVVAAIFLLLGAADFNSAGLPDFQRRLPVALVLFGLGSAFGAWSYLTFGLRNTLGLGVRLITHGPYRYTRNPEYIGDSLNILGYVVLTNSWMVWLLGALGLTLNILAPFTEEPWLEERFGAEYRAYKQAVPRFIPLGRRKTGRS